MEFRVLDFGLGFREPMIAITLIIGMKVIMGDNSKCGIVVQIVRTGR